jgi:hypothetical protein
MEEEKKMNYILLDVNKLSELLEISKIESRKLMKTLNAKKISNKYFITMKMLTDYLEVPKWKNRH